jgi:uncharacterized ferritin-like protein (DUF455 family)
MNTFATFSAPPRVAEAAGSLSAIRALWERVFHITAGQIGPARAAAVKCALGRLMHLDAQGVDALRRRLFELRSCDSYDTGLSADLVILTNRLCVALPAMELKKVRAEMHDVLREMLSRHAGSTDPLCDEPSIRLIRALRSILDEADEVIAALDEGGCRDQQSVSSAASAAAIAMLPPLLTAVPAREGHLRVVPAESFKAVVHVPREQATAFILHTIAYCVEIPAVEICAHMVLAHDELPWEAKRDLARQACDEARHFEILRRRVLELGGVMGDFPIHLGVWQYCQLGRDAAEQLCLQQVIQEGHGLDANIVFSGQQARIGDPATAAIFDFIGADETGHVRTGCTWLRHLAGDDEQKALEVFHRGYEMLLAHGYAPKDPVQEPQRLIAGMTRKQIARAKQVVLDIMIAQFSGRGEDPD